jgi:CPA1 family monovalent cation:H+ antiporter
VQPSFREKLDHPLPQAADVCGNGCHLTALFAIHAHNADLHERCQPDSLIFGVVIVSIFAQGLTMAPLLRWFGVVRVAADRRAYDFRRGQIVAVQAALDSLDQAARSHAVASEMVTMVRQEYEVVLSAAEAEIGRIRQKQPGLRDEALVRLKRYLAAVERNAIGQAARHGLIDSHVAQELSRAVDARLASLAGSASEEEDL